MEKKAFNAISKLFPLKIIIYLKANKIKINILTNGWP